MRYSIIISCVTMLLLNSCNSGKERNERIAFLESEIEHLQDTNDNLLSRLEDLAIISKQDSESIRESLSSLNQQYAQIEELTDRIHQRDSLNLALVHNLKRSLIDIDDEDVNVEVKGNAVYVTLSEQMLFPTASSRINNAAHTVLDKVATIINDHSDLQVLVQGHTDDVPIDNKHYSDNWDLSVSRATAVVRVLQDNFDVDPSRLTAAGRGEYYPTQDNETAEGRRINRRTEIVITPDLSQFFELLDSEMTMS